jgi:hypothetical protein
MLNYRNIIDDFAKLAKNHKQINSFSSGDINQLVFWTEQIDGKDNEKNNPPIYPLMYVIPSDVTRGEQEIVYGFNIIIADIMDTNNSYDIQKDLWSDTLQIAEDILAQFKYSVTNAQGDYEGRYDLELPTTITAFNEAYTDNLVGWNLDISIVLDNPLNRCIAPYNNFD